MKLIVLALLCALFGQSLAWSRCRDRDYTCIDRSSFCQAGKRVQCPDGTRCKTPTMWRGYVKRSPCVTDTRSGDCPWGDFVCASDRSFCLGGQEMNCAPGTVCNEFAPCENPRRPQRKQCKKWNYQCNGMSSFCLKGEIIECPAGTFCLDWAPCVSWWSQKKRLQ